MTLCLSRDLHYWDFQNSCGLLLLIKVLITNSIWIEISYWVLFLFVVIIALVCCCCVVKVLFLDIWFCSLFSFFFLSFGYQYLYCQSSIDIFSQIVFSSIFTYVLWLTAATTFSLNFVLLCKFLGWEFHCIYWLAISLTIFS